MDGYFKNFVSEELQFDNVNKIFPTKQRDIAILVDKLKTNHYINRIIVFGSSVTLACNPWSDIDIYIEYKGCEKPSAEIPYKEIDSAIDCWDNFSVDDRLLIEIESKGVVVYER